MPAGLTYESLATTTLSSDTATIDFTSISGSYTDLVLVMDQIQTDNAGTSYNAVRIKLNNDTSTTYSFTGMEGSGTTVIGAFDSNNNIFVGFAPQASGTGKGQLILQIMNYSNTTTFKPILSRSGATSYGTQTRVHIYQTTSAVNRVTVYFEGTVKYKSGTSATLYGIKAA